MDATCCLSAAPLPQTACLTSFGVGSSISDLRLRGGEERHAARLADRHRGLNVALEEEALDRDPLGTVLGDDRSQRRMQPAKALRVGILRIGADAAGIHEAQRTGFELDHAESADGGPGIDAERDHVRMVARADGSLIRFLSYGGVDTVRVLSYDAVAVRNESNA